ncbi:MAG: SURF1 family protein [Devosia sp.]
MSEAAAPRLGIGFWGFIALMLALTVLFVALGVWQLERLAWKDGLVAEVAERMAQPPVDLPAAAAWPSLVADDWAFRPVRATGHYLPEATVLVFTGLSDPKGQSSGAGYWVMMPLVLASGGAVVVNRGFIPQSSAASFAAGQGADAGDVTVSGVAVTPEAPGAFTPAADTANRIDYVRDPGRLATLAGITGPVLPLIIDLPAGPPGALPQGGETVVEFPNNHLGYAFTWFGFAIITPALLAFWISRQMRPRKPNFDGNNGPP